MSSKSSSFSNSSSAESEAAVDALADPQPPAPPPASNSSEVEASSPARSAGAQRIADHMLGDQPAKSKKEDRLGFGIYVAAVAKFLTDSSTRIPLTLSIEGRWGSGKTSFMWQLQEALRSSGKKKVVAFNAWQYNADDGLWAAFIHEFDDELNKQLTWGERIRARWMLFKLRVRWQGWVETLTTIFWLAASLVAFLAIAAYLRHGGIAAFQALLKESGEIEKSANKTIALVGGIGGAVASLLLFLNQLKGLFKSPASFDTAARLFAKPNYDGRLPLIHQLTRDFNSLVTAYAGNDDVYVFIDDLDRCEYAKAADLMQALLMLLSSAPKIALIIGLDRDKVAAAMATKQEKLIPYLYRIQPGEAYKRGMEYGQRFIEKFIQVSFLLPTPRPIGLKAMVNPEVKPPTEAVPDSQKSEAAINIVTGKDDSETLNRMIEMADEVFDHNPRNVKQFVNMFRLQAFIANETGLFGSWRTSTRTGRPLTIPQLGKFVLLCMRWPDFVLDASEDPELVLELESAEATPQDEDAMPADATNAGSLTGQAAFWFEDQGLTDLLKFGLFAEDDSELDYSLADVDFRLLNEIAPPRPKSSAELAREAVATPSPRVEAPQQPEPTYTARSTSPSKSAPSRPASTSPPRAQRNSQKAPPTRAQKK
jgi:hypothetical protein